MPIEENACFVKKSNEVIRETRIVFDKGCDQMALLHQINGPGMPKDLCIQSQSQSRIAVVENGKTSNLDTYRSRSIRILNTEVGAKVGVEVSFRSIDG